MIMNLQAKRQNFHSFISKTCEILRFKSYKASIKSIVTNDRNDNLYQFVITLIAEKSSRY